MKLWFERLDSRARGFILSYYYDPTLLPGDAKTFESRGVRADHFSSIISSINSWIENNAREEVDNQEIVVEAKARLNLLDYRLIYLCYGLPTRGLLNSSKHLAYMRKNANDFLTRSTPSFSEIYETVQDLVVYEEKYGNGADLSLMARTADEILVMELLSKENDD